MKTQYQAVLFDLGNVVIQTHFDRCFRGWAKASNKSAEGISTLFKVDEAYAAHEISKISGREYHAHICKILNFQISFEDFLESWNLILGDTISETIELIRDLKPLYKIFALTNSNQLHREVWAEKYKCDFENFDRIFCSSQIRLRKPNPEAFEKIIQETGIPKERFVFVDDLIMNIRGGEDFGIKSVLFSDPEESVKKLRDLLLS